MKNLFQFRFITMWSLVLACSSSATPTPRDAGMSDDAGISDIAPPSEKNAEDSISVAENLWTVSSPNGELAFSVALDDEGALSYSVKLADAALFVDAPLGLELADGSQDLSRALTFVAHEAAIIDEEFEMPVGKTSRVSHQGTELKLSYSANQERTLTLVLRAYDHGFAFRYVVDGDSEKPLELGNENTGFRLPPNAELWAQNYSSNYERPYSKVAVQDGALVFSEDVGFPLLVHEQSGTWMMFTEAGMDGTYAGGRLRQSQANPTLLQLALEGTVQSALPLETPWRVVLVSSRLSDIVESNTVTALSAPSKIADSSWIEPGVVTFPWLSDHGVNGKSERLKEFVDFAAEMGWRWIEFDSALVYGDSGPNAPYATWMSAPWIPEVVDYATSKGVKVAGWDAWNNLDTPEKREHILGALVDFGFSGIKVDFLDSDSLERFRVREEILQATAEKKLMVSFHGSSLPRGQQRTWPHIATWESVKGEEHYTFGGSGPSPSHNTNLCFTRNPVGSMDYTPGSFSYDKRQSTDAHQIALPIVFESGWQSLGPAPEHVPAEAREIWRNLPAAWDETRLVDGYPGELCVIARRKGSTWYLAGINGGDARTLDVSLGFLSQGGFALKLAGDGPDGTVLERSQVEGGQELQLELKRHGGFAAQLLPL